MGKKPFRIPFVLLGGKNPVRLFQHFYSEKYSLSFCSRRPGFGQGNGQDPESAVFRIQEFPRLLDNMQEISGSIIAPILRTKGPMPGGLRRGGDDDVKTLLRSSRGTAFEQDPGNSSTRSATPFSAGLTRTESKDIESKSVAKT